jgi:ribosomal protein L12E/L44/L45/RPP1/RPP2
MKLTRVILLALAFVIPTATTSLASAADEPAAAGDTAKPAKGKKGKKAKKDKKEGDEKKEEAK